MLVNHNLIEGRFKKNFFETVKEEYDGSDKGAGTGNSWKPLK